jgi:GAF domain
MINVCTLKDVLINEELAVRPVRAMDPELEMQALRRLVQRLSDESSNLLDDTILTVCELCGAASAGITLVERQNDGSETLRWVATTGAIHNLGLQSLPRDHSPCGVVLDTQAPQLFYRPRRFFTYIEESWDVGEVLLVPWTMGGKLCGTLWAVMPDDSSKFDREDLRRLQNLVMFASVAVCRSEIEASKRVREDVTSAAKLANELAHLMNNPLQALTNSLYLIDAGEGVHLEDAKRELERLSDLVRTLLESNARPRSISEQRSTLAAQI